MGSIAHESIKSTKSQTDGLQQKSLPTPSPSNAIVGTLQSKSSITDPSSPLSTSQIMQMQRTMGNRAVAQLMKSRGVKEQAAPLPSTKPVLQAKGMSIDGHSSSFTAQMKSEGDGVIQRAQSSEELQATLKTIYGLSKSQRQELLRSGFVSDTRNNVTLSPTQKTMIISSLLENSMKWQNTDTRPGRPGVNTFGKHFDTDKKELDEKENPLGNLNESTMNCWESIMYAGYLAGAVDRDDIQDNLLSAESMDTIYSYIAGPARKLRTQMYNIHLDNEDKELLTEYEDITNDKPEYKAKTAEVNQTLLRAMGRIEVGEEGKVVSYGLNGNEFSHFTLSLGANMVMSLNGEGKSVGVSEAGNIANIIPAWNDDNSLTISDKIETVEDSSLSVFTPPWEVAQAEEVASDNEEDGEYKEAASTESTSTVDPTESVASSSSGTVIAPVITILSSTDMVREWVESMGSRYDKGIAVQQMGADTFDTWLATTFNVKLSSGAASGLMYMIP